MNKIGLLHLISFNPIIITTNNIFPLHVFR